MKLSEYIKKVIDQAKNEDIALFDFELRLDSKGNVTKNGPHKIKFTIVPKVSYKEK